MPDPEWAYIAAELTEGGATPLTPWLAKRLRQNMAANIRNRTPHYSIAWEMATRPIVSTPSEAYRAIAYMPVRISMYTTAIKVRVVLDHTSAAGSGTGYMRLTSLISAGEPVAVNTDGSTQSVDLEITNVRAPNSGYAVVMVAIEVKSVRCSEWGNPDVIGVDQQHVLITSTDLSTINGAAHYELVQASAKSGGSQWWHVCRVADSINGPYGDEHARSEMHVWPWVTTADGWPSFGDAVVSCDLYHLSTWQLQSAALWAECDYTLPDALQYNAGQSIAADDMLALKNQTNFRHIPLLYGGRVQNSFGIRTTANEKFAGALFTKDTGSDQASLLVWVQSLQYADETGTLTVTVEDLTDETSAEFEEDFQLAPRRRAQQIYEGSLSALNSDQLVGPWGAADAEFTLMGDLQFKQIRVQLPMLPGGNLIRVSVETSIALRCVAGILIDGTASV